MPITAQTSVIRSPNVLITPIGDVLVALSPTGEYWELNPTGQYIWARIAEPTTVSAVAANISATYDQTHEVSLADTMAFLDQLCALGFLELLGE